MLDIKAPRWDSYSRSEWAKLATMIRETITKRETQRDKALQKKLEKLRQEAEPNCKSVHIETEKEPNHEVQE